MELIPNFDKKYSSEQERDEYFRIKEVIKSEKLAKYKPRKRLNL
jgi:hypothetical protein